jgi:hypothetical protein
MPRISRQLASSHRESCKLRNKLALKIRGATSMDQLTGPPIVAHVSTNESMITISRGPSTTSTGLTSPEGQEDPMCGP